MKQAATARVVQWQGDNAGEIEALLGSHLARADQKGDKLVLTGIGLSTELIIGDSVVLDGDRLGVIRARTPNPTDEIEVTWAGDNLETVANFLGSFQVRLEVVGFHLCLHGDKSGKAWFVLNRGDKLIRRDGQIVVSKTGKDHRN